MATIIRRGHFAVLWELCSSGVFEAAVTRFRHDEHENALYRQAEALSKSRLSTVQVRLDSSVFRNRVLVVCQGRQWQRVHQLDRAATQER